MKRRMGRDGSRMGCEEREEQAERPPNSRQRRHARWGMAMVHLKRSIFNRWKAAGAGIATSFEEERWEWKQQQQRKSNRQQRDDVGGDAGRQLVESRAVALQLQLEGVQAELANALARGEQFKSMAITFKKLAVKNGWHVDGAASGPSSAQGASHDEAEASMAVVEVAAVEGGGEKRAHETPPRAASYAEAASLAPAATPPREPKRRSLQKELDAKATAAAEQRRVLEEASEVLARQTGRGTGKGKGGRGGGRGEDAQA